jgi:hypothetical protein
MVMLSRAEPIRHHCAGLVISRPPKPNLMLFISVKTPHFVHFDAYLHGGVALKILLVDAA